MGDVWQVGLGVGLPTLIVFIGALWKLMQVVSRVDKVAEKNQEQIVILRDFAKKIAVVDSESERRDLELQNQLHAQGGQLHTRINEVVQQQHTACKDQVKSCREEFRELGRRLDEHLARHRNGQTK